MLQQVGVPVGHTEAAEEQAQLRLQGGGSLPEGSSTRSMGLLRPGTPSAGPPAAPFSPSLTSSEAQGT